DASGDDAEARLGFYTNTGDEAAPVAEVPVREYRKDYYREGILKNLAAEGRADRAIKKWEDEHKKEPARPALRPRIDEGVLAGDRLNVLRAPKATLLVGLNREYELDDNHVLKWRVTRTDGEKVRKDEAEATGTATLDGREWKADLSDLSWRRGEYPVRTALYARAGDREPLTSEQLTIRFQPPPATVELRLDGKKVVATKDK